MEARSKFFKELMNILDQAESIRDTNFGPFSFLGENSYVRNAVVTSCDTSTSITGLKMYLAMNVLELHTKGNESNISLNQLQAILDGNASKQYSLNYNVLDECIDVKKNKKAVLENMYAPIEDETIIKHVKETEILIPFIFMEKLRKEVWYRLREFFKLCEQNVCSGCSKKSMVYFQFLQAVALYEIFYIEFVQESAADYMEQVVLSIQKMQERVTEMTELGKSINVENLQVIRRISESLFGVQEDMTSNVYHVGLCQLLVIEFGISLNAMCYLLMVFEAMQVCDYKMRGIKHLSLEIQKKLDDIYEKDLSLLVKSNHKRYKRYRDVNKKLEELLKNQYPSCQDYDAADVIYTFMEELCKPMKQQDKNLMRGFEVLLGYPIYMEE